MRRNLKFFGGSYSRKGVGLILLSLILGLRHGFTQTLPEKENRINTEAYDREMSKYYTGLVTPQGITTAGWALLGRTHVDNAAPYALYYYKLLRVNSNDHRYASIIDVSVQGDANYFDKQATYRIRVDKFQNTQNRFDGLEIKCISGNPETATFYIYKNGLWLRSNYKWGRIYYRTVADFTSKSPLVGAPFNQTTTAPAGYLTSTSSYGLKCDLDNTVFYKLPYTDAGGNVLVNGNVGIGTKNPQSKLAVNGTITAQKVKVTQAGWPDYVLDTAYYLTPLNDLKSFIALHKHLPGIPSAKEIRDKGLDLGDMQKGQMQKIEELTRYIVNMNEKVQRMEGKIKALREQIIKLKSK